MCTVMTLYKLGTQTNDISICIPASEDFRQLSAEPPVDKLVEVVLRRQRRLQHLHRLQRARAGLRAGHEAGVLDLAWK